VDFGHRRLYLDNYYEIQYLHHYLPQETALAYSPIYNNPDEFQAWNVDRFIRDVVRQDPLLVYYDCGALKSCVKAGTDLAWFDRNFARTDSFVNEDARFLFKRGLNLFPIIFSGPEMQVIRLHYNQPSDTAGWFRRQGVALGAAFGGDWHHLTIRDPSGQWQHHWAAERQATVLLFNGTPGVVTGRLTFAAHACAPNQTVRVRRDAEVVSSLAVRTPPASGVDLQSQQSFRQYVPLGSLLRKTRGLFNPPIVLQMEYQPVSSAPLPVPPGVTPVFLEPVQEGGILARGLRLETDGGGAPAARPDGAEGGKT
jgi:hypothetical protein